MAQKSVLGKGLASLLPPIGFSPAGLSPTGLALEAAAAALPPAGATVQSQPQSQIQSSIHRIIVYMGLAWQILRIFM